jgi:hypothetical protein
MQSKAMAKVIAYEIKECTWKEKEEWKFKRANETLSIVKCATQRSIEK